MKDNRNRRTEGQMTKISKSLGYDLETLRRTGGYVPNSNMGYEEVVEDVRRRKRDFVRGFEGSRENPIFGFCLRQFTALEETALGIYRRMN